MEFKVTVPVILIEAESESQALAAAALMLIRGMGPRAVGTMVAAGSIHVERFVPGEEGGAAIHAAEVACPGCGGYHGKGDGHGRPGVQGFRAKNPGPAESN